MEEKNTKVGKLHYTISVDESALIFVSKQQEQIDYLDKQLENIMMKLLNKNQQIIYDGDYRMKTIIEEIDKLQKQLTNTKSN